MTIHNEKTPVTAPTVNEGTKSIPERSVTTAYLAKHGDNTRHTFGTWSGKSIPQDDHITIIISMEAARTMFADGPQLVALNPECVAAQSAAARKVREEEERRERAELRRRIADRITEEEGFEEHLAHLDAQATVIYDQIDKKVDAVLEEMGKKP
ncbi:hypothetical protein [Corynebacterium gallinarum]|uniref:Uncharacterized protein n=1 Tax=Corynebacterium gallinarum TaxID=2762214 RepID=A0A8I0HQ17_9CORY|nr:hypothetical protein [Corynebacterium gallinarum]MBD8030801.1 hypothetical protein [Corynebacterium gallinarum]